MCRKGMTDRLTKCNYDPMKVIEVEHEAAGTGKCALGYPVHGGAFGHILAEIVKAARISATE
jgi:hypothetical protein